MNVKELRIGNLVSISDYNNLEVLGISSNNVGLKLDSTKFISVQHNELQPILLTEEWLLKFGFEKMLCTQIIYTHKLYENFQISFWNGKIEFSINVNDEYEELLCKLNSVHELQNLFYALTKKELTIKK